MIFLRENTYLTHLYVKGCLSYSNRNLLNISYIRSQIFRYLYALESVEDVEITINDEGFDEKYKQHGKF